MMCRTWRTPSSWRKLTLEMVFGNAAANGCGETKRTGDNVEYLGCWESKLQLEGMRFHARHEDFSRCEASFDSIGQKQSFTAIEPACDTLEFHET